MYKEKFIKIVNLQMRKQLIDRMKSIKATF